MYADMLAFAAKYAEEGTPLDIVKTPYWRIWMPDTKQQRKLNCSHKTVSIPPSSRSPSPAQRTCCATTRASGRPSTATRSWASTASASRKFPVPTGPTTPS